MITRLLPLLWALAVAEQALADTLRVPGDHSTVQEALDAAQDGDTVLVADGEYEIADNIDFNRMFDPQAPEGVPLKDIVLRSEGGPEKTTLRWPKIRFNAFVFESGETRKSRVEGFTCDGGG